MSISDVCLLDTTTLDPNISLDERCLWIRESVDTIKLYQNYFSDVTDEFLNRNSEQLQTYETLCPTGNKPTETVIFASVMAEDVPPLKDLHKALFGPPVENPVERLMFHPYILSYTLRNPDIRMLMAALTDGVPAVFNPEITLLDVCYTVETYKHLVETVKKVAKQYPVTLN